MLCSSFLAQILPPKHNCHLLYAHSSCPSWLSFIAVVIQDDTSWLSETKLFENLTYVPHVARSYRVKLQHHKYTERCTRKIPIWLTSVGLTHARPNYFYFFHFFFLLGQPSQQPKYNVNMLATLWELVYPFPDVTNVFFSSICKGQSETVEFVKH